MVYTRMDADDTTRKKELAIQIIECYAASPQFNCCRETIDQWIGGWVRDVPINRFVHDHHLNPCFYLPYGVRTKHDTVEALITYPLPFLQDLLDYVQDRAYLWDRYPKAPPRHYDVHMQAARRSNPGIIETL